MFQTVFFRAHFLHSYIFIYVYINIYIYIGVVINKTEDGVGPHFSKIQNHNIY